ncbi:tetratricopeptide repeat protein [Streptomyces sp. NBC_01264]|uniref:tetratricopeptide repeat protein n=1 Tax=Streptomyces sp. NBC_01264 TaxID=2903804 RepID=UPI00224D7EDC|nr:tetratricopeptide repeat protein [Streptomyces sp. NBC_01264]MCX4780934.1 tetratricopeptide repeat protein [Streptomyces sp. NBC_01264]
MAGRGPSRQELIRRRRSVGFIGRQGEVSAFREALRQPPEEAAQFLFHVRGPGGVGKSTLVRHLDSIAREAGAVTAYVDESVADVIETMEAVSAQFAQRGLAMKAFDKLLATYRQRRHEADAGLLTATTGPDAAITTAPPPSPSSVIASQLGLVGLGMIPGAGALTGAVDPNQVAIAADRVKALLSTRLRNHGDVELVLSPLDALTPVFLEELAEVARKHPWIVLFFDTYERTGPMLDTWLRDVLGSERYGEFPANVLVTLAGQSKLAARTWQDWHDLVTDWPLEVFTEPEARLLLTGKGITDERVVEVILRLSGRLPVLVSTLAETQPGSLEELEEIGDPSGTAVERFLKWVPDPAGRAAALACAFPQELDEDVYRAAVEEEAAELFGWLRSMPFVTDRSGHCRYHEVVRGAMLRLQRRQSPIRWEQLHTRLADAFRLRRERLEEAPAPSEGWWSDETWRGHRLQEAYHRLCADPRTALPPLLRDLVDAYDHGITTLHRWTATLTAAARDTDSPALTRWSEDLRAALDQPAPGTAALTLLLTRAGLDHEGRATTLILRGRDHRVAEDYVQAVADYTQALALDPGAVRAHLGRALTHLLTSSDDEAIADYTRVIEVDPGHASSLIDRGMLYRWADRYEESLADLNRAVETVPDDQWALAERGATYHAMARYEEALADFARALAAQPAHETLTLVRRADTFEAMGRHEEALDDFRSAIELSPDYGWAYFGRAHTLRDLGRYEEALADFTRAVELSPDDASTVAGRADTCRAVGRYEEALVDYTRAIELDPGYGWAFTGRADTALSLRRYDEALADCGHAIAHDPNAPWAFYLRATAWIGLGRFDRACTDFDQVHALTPDDSWVFRRRGDCRIMLGTYEQALTDYSRAVELRPGDASTLTARGATHRLLGHYDAASADLARASELDPDDGWTHYESAVVMTALQHPDRDHHLTRAVELLNSPAAGERSASEVGDLLLVHCLWLRWEQAERYLAEFLDAAPPPGQVREFAVALRSLVPVVPSAEPRIEVFCQLLEEQLAEPPQQPPHAPTP